MALAGQTNLDTARTTVETSVNEVFGDRPPGVWSAFTTVVPASGTKYELNVVDGAPAPREWIGSKQFGGLRAYKLSGDLRKWERSLRIAMDDIRGDSNGVVNARLADFVSSTGDLYDYILLTELLSNPTGYDGVALMSNSHPNVGGSGTSDNLTTADLSFTELRNAREAMWEMKDEAGEPLNVTPTDILVGPESERIAMEITGSDRPVAVSNAGALDATSNVVAVTNLKHFDGGSLRVHVSPRIGGGQFFIMDLSRGRRKPMYLFEFEGPRADIKDDPKDDNVFFQDEALYSITAKASPAAGDWHCIYGSVTA